MGERVDTPVTSPRWLGWHILLLLMAFSFMSWLNRTSIAIAYDTRLKRQFEISEEQIGYVYSAFFLAYAVCMAPGGWFADRFGARTALMFVGFGSGAFVALIGAIGLGPPTGSVQVLGMTVASVWLLLLLIRFVMGVFMAPIYPASGRAVGNWISLPRRASANGLITGAALVGNASSFILFGALIDAWNWPAAFLVTGIITGVVTLAWMALARDHPDRHFEMNPPAARQGTEQGNLWRLLGNRSLMLLTISYAAIGYFEYLFFFWMHHYFVDVQKLGETKSRYYTSVALLAMAAGMVVGGWLSDRFLRMYGRRWGRLLVAVGGMVGGAILLLAGLRASEPVSILVWFSLALAAVGATEGPFWTTAIELGKRRSATAFGIFNTGGNLGGLLAPSVTPWVCFHLPAEWDEITRWKIAISIGSVVCFLGAILWCGIDPGEPVSETGTTEIATAGQET
jgi:MFS transporter, ACS family, D-galactonate transporter